MKRFKIIIMIVFIINILLIGATFAYASSNDNNKKTANNESIRSDNTKAAKYLGAALAVLGATLASGIAVGKIGSAAMGAMSENADVGGSAIIFVALAEGICLWGLAGAALILFF